MKAFHIRIAILALLCCFACKANGQYTATVNVATQYQTLEGFGTALSWAANAVGGWSDPNRTNYVNGLFAAPPNGLGLNYARYNIAGGDCPGCNYIEWPHNIPGYQPTKNGAFVYTADANQQWVAKLAYSDGVDFFEGQSNSPPWWMTVSGSSTGGASGADNLNSSYIGTGANTFPAYLATVAEYFSNTIGIPFREVEAFNEPEEGWWKYQETKQEGCKISTSQEQSVIQDLSTLLKTQSPLTSVAAMDDYKIDDAETDLTGYSSATLAAMNEVHTHAYSGTERTQLAASAAADGKRMVMSEWGSGDDSGKDLSTELTDDMINMKAVDWSIWQPDWPGLYTANYSAGTYSINEAYYTYGNYSEYIRPGYIFVNTNDANSLAAYNGYTNTFVIVTMNWTGNAVPVTYDLTNFHSLGGTAQGYQTSSSQKLSNIGTEAISSSSFKATLPANSATTWVVANAVYTPTATSYNDTAFTYSSSECGNTWCYGTQSGAYDGDNHWSSQANSDYTYAFTGTQARVYGQRKNNQGIAAFSIDGGAETDVDTYAATSTQDGLVYSTPTLSSANHTLKVRVTGLKNSKSSGIDVQADRIDIVP